jgi:hypothetical protein
VTVMALISRFERYQPDRHSRHEAIDCLWFAFDADGDRILQLRTDGSSLRKVPGKASQTIQLDRGAAEQLLEVLTTTFPGLGASRT